ncbi:MAG: hypothetical protein ACK4RG_02850 [Fimbriimonadales bacterium]
MRPNAKWSWLGLGMVILALLVVRGFRTDDSRGVVRLKDRSTVRLLQLTRGTTHEYNLPFWRKWLEKVGWVSSSGVMEARLTSPKPEVWVWLQQQFSPANSNALGDAPRVRLVDSQGAYLAHEEYFISQDQRKRIFVVRLPQLPPSEHQVWIEFPDGVGENRIRVPPPYVGRAAPPRQPQPLPASIKSQEFEFELQKLAIVDGGVWIHEGVEYPLLQIQPRSQFYEDGRPSNNWVIEEYWLEDPYGNRYDPTHPPPWHYPYWLFCATVYPSYKASSISPRAWRSSWISRRRGVDTPINARVRQAGITLELLGVFENPQFTLQVDPTLPNQYRVLSPSRATLRNQRGSSFAKLVPAGQGMWQVRTEEPILIWRIELPLTGAWSWRLGSNGAIIFNGHAINILLQDERGRLFRAPATLAAVDTDSSIIGLVKLNPSALASGRFRVIVDTHPPRTIRIPIAPLDKEQVLKMWSLQGWGRSILR